VKAWLVYPGGELRLGEVSPPALSTGWAEIRVQRFQVSVTEALGLAGRPGIEHNLIKSALAAAEPRQMFGHEFCGVVMNTAGDVGGLDAGDRVTSLGKIVCEMCDECRAGRPRFCMAGEILGIHFPGAFAELVQVPARALVDVPTSISDLEAAALQPLSSCIAAYSPAATLAANGTVVVIGLGPMGLFLAQLARNGGASKVIALGRRRETLDAALANGADLAIEFDADAADNVAEATHGLGADVVFEAAGAIGGSKEPFEAPTLDLAARIARRGGSIFEVSTFPGRLQFDATTFRAKSIRYRFLDFAIKDDLAEAARLVEEKRITVDVSHVFEGLDALPEAVQVTLAKSESALVGTAQVVVND
jgi:threonine dehydrogenase-like Zn-dependent dehydrogenase